MEKHERYSKEKMFGLVEQWQSSGLNQTDFCIQENIILQNFSYWINKYNREEGFSCSSEKIAQKSFIPVTFPKVDTCSSMVGVEVSYPNGIRLTFTQGVNLNDLKMLLNP